MTERIDIEEKQERKPNHTRVTIHKTNRLSFTLLGLIAILWLFGITDIGENYFKIIGQVILTIYIITTIIISYIIFLEKYC